MLEIPTFLKKSNGIGYGKINFDGCTAEDAGSYFESRKPDLKREIANSCHAGIDDVEEISEYEYKQYAGSLVYEEAF